MNKVTVVLSSVSLIGLLATACGQPANSTAVATSNGNINISFWHGYAPAKEAVLKEYIAKYESEHPNIHIHEQFIANGDAMLPKLQAALVSDQLPDISWGYPTWTGVLTSSGKLVDVQNLMNKQDESDFYPGVLQANKYQGQIYSLPIEAGTLELIYNKDKFNAAGIKTPPQNWDELRTDAKKLTKNGTYGLYVSSGPGERTTWTWETFLWQNGGQLVQGKQAAFGQPAGQKAMQFYTDLMTKDNVSPKGNVNVDTAFQNGQVAMVISTQGTAEKYEKKFKMNVGVAPLPEGKVKATGLGSNTLFLFKSNPAEQKAAWDFMSWLTNSTNNAEWAIDMGYLPVRKSSVNSVNYSDFSSKDPAFAVASQSLPFGISRPSEAFYPAMSDAISSAVQNIVFGKETVSQALAEAVTKSNGAISSGQ